MTSRYDSEGQPELEGNYFSEVGMKWEVFFLFPCHFNCKNLCIAGMLNPFYLVFCMYLLCFAKIFS